MSPQSPALNDQRPDLRQVRIQRQMIVWTFVLTLVLGFITVSVLLQPPETDSSVASHGHSPHRVPASMSSSSSHLSLWAKSGPLALTEKNQAIDAEISCDGDSLSFPSDVSQIRLSGGSCHHHADFRASQILNETNGYSATTFFPSGRDFTTDYIALASGLNRIHILHEFKDGHKEERVFEITRAAK